MLVYRIRLPERRGVASRTLSVGVNDKEPQEVEIEDLKSEVSEEYEGEIGDVIKVKLTDLDADGEEVGKSKEETFVLTRTLAPRDRNEVGIEVLREQETSSDPNKNTLVGAGEFSQTPEKVQEQSEEMEDDSEVPDDDDQSGYTDPN